MDTSHDRYVSRLLYPCFITRKRPGDVIDSMMTHWIGKFGVMGSFVDREFSSEEMREVASIFKMFKCVTTAAEKSLSKWPMRKEYMPLQHDVNQT